MSEQAARSWLAKHSQVIPALQVHHRRALDIIEDRSKTLRDLADVVAVDPGLSITLLHEVNNKLKLGGKPPVDSVSSALGLLGDSVIADLVMQHPVLEQDIPDIERRRSYQQLVSRIYHLLAQLDAFIALQGVRAVEEVHCAGLLHNVGEICACLFAHEHYLKYLDKFREVGIGANSAKAVFGFSFHELGRQYADRACLPPLVTESLDENIPPGRKARLIQLAADIAHQAETGWYHMAMKATADVAANFLNQAPDELEKNIHRVAVEAARACPLADVLPAAARLILQPDRDPGERPRPAVEETPRDKGRLFETRVKALLKLPRATQAQLLELLMSHLHDDLHLSRVVLMLLSGDRDKLGTRAARGLDPDSPIRTLVLDVSQPGLLKSLLAKPQALWVDPDSYPKYEPALSPKFKASFLHENFFLMSLFIANRPIGLVFCDRALSVHKLDKTCYNQFKSALLLTGMGLTYLAKRRPKGSV